MKYILESNENGLITLISAIVAIIALLQTHKQIKISNKQYLFDKRLSKYLLTKGLLELYKDNENLLDYTDDSDNEAIIVDYQFINLTNNNYLKDVACIIMNQKITNLRITFWLKLRN